MIWGPASSGKTHLLHATSSALSNRVDGETIRLTGADNIKRELVDAIKHDRHSSYLAKSRAFRSLIVDGPVLAVDQWLRDRGARVLIDDRDFWAGDDIQDQIVRVINAAGIVVCFCSESSASRPYPKLEQRLAQEFERMSAADATAKRLIYFCLDDTVLPVEQTFRLAVQAKGKTFLAAWEELWRGITRSVAEPKAIDLSRYRDRPPWKGPPSNKT